MHDSSAQLSVNHPQISAPGQVKKYSSPRNNSSNLSQKRIQKLRKGGGGGAGNMNYKPLRKAAIFLYDYFTDHEGHAPAHPHPLWIRYWFHYSSCFCKIYLYYNRNFPWFDISMFTFFFFLVCGRIGLRNVSQKWQINWKIKSVCKMFPHP